jgi:Molybdopterin-binding domain of aldehyde dehydrogenase
MRGRVARHQVTARGRRREVRQRDQRSNARRGAVCPSLRRRARRALPAGREHCRSRRRRLPRFDAGEDRPHHGRLRAAALYEELAYSEQGQLQSASLIDYLVPTAAEIPAIEIHHLQTPSQFSETGAKGMGEGGAIGAPACIASAVADALAHLGVQVDQIPITPERLLGAIEAAGAEATRA